MALVVVAVLAIASAMGISSAASGAPAVGAAAPDFTLNSQEGRPVSLHDLKGKWVVLYFYPKDFTTGCTIEAHNFQRDLAQYEQKNAVIVGVSVQDEDSHQKFCTKEGLSFKLLADTKQGVSSQYDSVMTYNEAKS
jgi:thioredoxin-dependent peroxiredoxin